MNLDKEIINGILNKDERVLRLLLYEYGGLIKSVVSYHLKYFPLYIEECMQDVLISVWQNIDRYDCTKNSLKNWIGAVAKYKCIDYKRKYFKEFSLEELDESIANPEGFIESEIEDDINSILECLKPKDRELFYRYYILGDKIESIAKVQNKTTTYLYKRLSRGRVKIRNSLQRGKFL